MYETAISAAPHFDQVEKRLSGLRDDLNNLRSRVIGLRDELLGERPNVESAMTDPPIGGGFIGKSFDHLQAMERVVQSTKETMAELESAILRDHSMAKVAR